LQELETVWTLDDVFRANALLDMRSDIETAITEKGRQTP